jgi:hypothetical protein
MSASFGNYGFKAFNRKQQKLKAQKLKTTLRRYVNVHTVYILTSRLLIIPTNFDLDWLDAWTVAVPGSKRECSVQLYHMMVRDPLFLFSRRPFPCRHLLLWSISNLYGSVSFLLHYCSKEINGREAKNEHRHRRLNILEHFTRISHSGRVMRLGYLYLFIKSWVSGERD